MEITERERMMLVKKKEEICGLTLKILDMAHDPQNSLEIKKNITTTLSLLSTIASYSNVKEENLDVFTSWADLIFSFASDYDDDSTDQNEWCQLIERELEEFCNAVNSIRFDFTNKRGIKIVLPKIKNLNLGVITNK